MSRIMLLATALGSAVLSLLSFAHANAAEFAVDNTHTSVHFGVAHFERSQMRGRFNRISVKQLQLDLEKGTGLIDLQIDPDSVDTGLPQLDGILKGEQFFDSKEYPFIRFQSEQFVFAGKQLQSVHGQLTLHGQTRPVVLQARRFQCGEVKIVFIKRYVCGGDFSASIKRSSFGLTRYLPDVGDQVQLEVSIEASPLMAE